MLGRLLPLFKVKVIYKMCTILDFNEIFVSDNRRSSVENYDDFDFDYD